MCWCKFTRFAAIAFIGSLMLSFTACKPDIKETGGTLKYFDIKGYFTADTARLNKLNTPVFKTVTYNGATESKKAKIENWGHELDLFIASDINKPAWRDSYTIIADSDVLLYKAKDPELKMREMIIKMDKQKVKWILIFNHTKNILYQTDEKLSYFPDSLYVVQKIQRIRLIGTNKYKIEGAFKR
jgi:hypothetical protein